MKANSIIAFAAAIATLVACSKEAETAVDANHFEKGQKVTFTVKAGEPSTRVSSALNGSNGIDFKWQTGDKIKVTVGDKSAEFTLSSGAGAAEATFTGTMPGSGDTFDVQYPYETPDLTSQTYSSTEALPHDKMLLTATGCDLSDDNPSFELTAQYSALRLNLWGADKTISKIVVRYTWVADSTFTLKFNEAETLPTAAAEARAFFIVVPAATHKFTAEVFDNSDTPESICVLTPSAKMTLAKGTILNMPAKEVVSRSYQEPQAVDLGLSVKWASFNVGATAETEYGTYFAWGDVTGQTWSGSSWSGGGFSTSSYPEYEIDSDNRLLPGYDAAYVNLGGSWRMPTKDEQDTLVVRCPNTWGNKGRTFTGNDQSIFLPAAGYGGSSITLREAGSSGRYWSGTFFSYSGSYYGCNLSFSSGEVSSNVSERYFGRSVRPVTE